nr:formyltransferase family protein [uncultured Helicobacter sp.]
MSPFCNTTRNTHQKFVFVGNRLEVLQAMLESCEHLTIYMQSQTYAARTLQNSLSTKHKRHYYEFSSKKELLALLQKLEFDVLVSNGCPYILPISQIQKPHQIFINCHPSLLPNLKGNHPINGAILFHQPSGATCHIMTDEIDSGAIISQVPVYNDDNISLPLLYQMCFLAEKEAFLLAMQRDFKPDESFLSHSTPPIPYYTRADSHLELDFYTQSTQHIIDTIKAFAMQTQGAYLKCNTSVRFIDAKLICNPFLERTFQESCLNDILLSFDNHILCKRAEGFLQLTLANTSTIPQSLTKNTCDIRSQTCITDSHTCNISHHCNTPQATIKANMAADTESSHIQTSIFSQDSYAKALLEPLLYNQKQIFHFSYTQGSKYFSNTAIIEPIPNTPYFDMSSPYGYGGYFSNSNDTHFLRDALQAQAKEAKKRNIIAEFIRFHPHFSSTPHFAHLLDFFDDAREIVVVDSNTQTRWQSYSSRLRGKLRKSLQALQVSQSQDTELFHTLYTQTMKRNNADEFYFFDIAYFKALLAMPQCVMLQATFEGKTAAMGIFLFDSLCGYYHLGANAEISLDKNLNAMGALFECFFELARQRGVSQCILGGGRGNDKQDSLFVFKKQFATHILHFTIGGKIYDKQAYQSLKANAESTMFLAYRAIQDSHKVADREITRGGGQYGFIYRFHFGFSCGLHFGFNHNPRFSFCFNGFNATLEPRFKAVAKAKALPYLRSAYTPLLIPVIDSQDSNLNPLRKAYA